MRKFIRQYLQEIIAVVLIAGFWTSVWGMQAYKATQARKADEQASVQYDPSKIEPEPANLAPGN